MHHPALFLIFFLFLLSYFFFSWFCWYFIFCFSVLQKILYFVFVMKMQLQIKGTKGRSDEVWPLRKTLKHGIKSLIICDQSVFREYRREFSSRGQKWISASRKVISSFYYVNDRLRKWNESLKEGNQLLEKKSGISILKNEISPQWRIWEAHLKKEFISLEGDEGKSALSKGISSFKRS